MKKLSFFFVVAFLLMSVATGMAEELTWCGEVQELELVEPEMEMMEGLCPYWDKPSCCVILANEYLAQCPQAHLNAAIQYCTQMLIVQCGGDPYCMQYYGGGGVYACAQGLMIGVTEQCYFLSNQYYQDCMNN